MTVYFTLLCLLAISSVTECVSVKANTNIIYVSAGGSIQEAINSANPGDTIFVQKGTYYEHVFVNKSVSLAGEDRDFTIVDGSGTDSVIVIRAKNVIVEGFTVKKSGTSADDSAIWVEHSSDIVISNNFLTENTCGFGLSFSSNCTFLNNIISNSFFGIYLSFSGTNIVSGNVVFNNDVGIYLLSSSGNIFAGNSILSNSNYGIYLILSGENTFYHNNLNNINQAEITAEVVNLWNYIGEGNYWSDYTERDLDGDGIGDYPYKIDNNNKDNNPLMGMFLDLTVTLKEVIYQVTVICNSTISDFRFEVGKETSNRIIYLNATGDGSVGFCRIRIPIELMNYPYIVLIGSEEISPTFLNISNETYAVLYLTYLHKDQPIIIISSEMLRLYNELLDIYMTLQTDLENLNATYYYLLNSYAVLIGNYSQLQQCFEELNATYYYLLNSYAVLIGNYSQLQQCFEELNATCKSLYNLNTTYYNFLSEVSVLIGNYSQLQQSFEELNATYQKHQLSYLENVHNIQNLIYIFAATTAIFIIITIYLSKRTRRVNIH